eukprot:UN20565
MLSDDMQLMAENHMSSSLNLVACMQSSNECTIEVSQLEVKFDACQKT